MRSLVVTLVAIIVFPLYAIAQYTTMAQQDKFVHINQIQVIGTHNSYHAGLPPSAAKLLKEKDPELFAALDYKHPSLARQLEEGVRQLEIDVFADPKGGLYAHPYIEKMVAAAELPPDPPYDQNGVMDKPGFKVMHVQDIDQRSVCEPFIACLKEVRAWSNAHPRHLPIFLLIETKQTPLKENIFPSVEPVPFTSAVFDALDRAIRSVFPAKDMITPDQVRGNYDTLLDAILASGSGRPTGNKVGGWPSLAKARGKVIFLMDQRPMEAIYTKGHPSLRGRVIFTNATPGAPDAAFTEMNNGTKEEIDALARQGYLIRTRTDEPTIQARTNDHTRADVALSSGAQMLSTDYPPSEPSKWTGYFVGLPHGLVARCNPVTAPPGCVSALLGPSGAK